MELEKQVASLELSKQLKELGVKQESLFYWVDGELRQGMADYKLAFERMEAMLMESITDKSPMEVNGKFVVGEHYSIEQDRRLAVLESPQRTGAAQREYNDHYSAFTVAELGEMLPYRWTTYKSNIDDEWIGLNTDPEMMWCDPLFEKVGANTEADARAKLLIHLMEEGIIKTNERD